MMQLYQDSMAIVGKFGKPDLFITMTFIQQWREMRKNVLRPQNAADRPDIVGRVFALKVDCYRISKERNATYTFVNHFKA